MGGFMVLLWLIRFFVFDLYESPKYLKGRGRDEQAVEVVHKVAACNGKTSNLTLEDLQRAGKSADAAVGIRMDSPALAVRRQMVIFSNNRVKSLFATRKTAWSTTILIILWAFIDLAFPLYNSFVTYFLATRGANFGDVSVYTTNRNQVILSVIGVPGALMAGYFVLAYLGRRGTSAIFTVSRKAFNLLLFAMITAGNINASSDNPSSDERKQSPPTFLDLTDSTARTSNALLGWNCGYSCMHEQRHVWRLVRPFT